MGDTTDRGYLRTLHIGVIDTENMTAEAYVTISESEHKLINELRARIGKENIASHFDETFLFYRFLKARDFNIDNAEIMLRKSLEWRKKNNIDTILTEYKAPEVILNLFENVHVGYDKAGAPFYYMGIGKYDVRGLHLSAKQSEMEKTLAQFSEKSDSLMEDRINTLNKRLKGHISIYDCEGLTFANATNKRGCETVIKLFKILQDNYPERIRLTLVINASSYFALFFSFTKTFISAGVINKLQVYGSDGWKEELLKYIDADQLPVRLGGTKLGPDGDPECKSIMNIGGKIDERFYIHKSSHSLTKHPGVKKLVLPRASFSEIVLKVKEPGSVIEYEFETKTRDIGFGLFYKELVNGDEKVSELVPLQRLETEEFSETGVYKCERAGEYVLLFDNSYSWMRSKEVYYVVTVKTAREVENSF